MYIVFDIGGTQMRLAASRDGRQLDESVSISTPQDPESGIEQFAELANDISESKDITAIVGGVAGPLSQQKTSLVNSPHLPEWVDFDIKDALQDACGVDEVHLENDTALVGLGEASVGAGNGFDIVAYITVSTGVGGVRIVKESIDENALGFEPGHQIINTEDFEEGERKNKRKEGSIPGHWEYYISGTQMEGRYDTHPHDIEDPAAWEQVENDLVYGLNNIAVLWSPDIVVLGGAMIVKKTGITIESVREKLEQTLTIFKQRPIIKKATLGDKGGLHGALTYLRQQRK